MTLEQPLELTRDVARANTALDQTADATARELIDDVQELQLTTVAARVVLEVKRPDVIGELGAEAAGGDR